MADNQAEYDVRQRAPGDLTSAELAACVAIIRSGGAVDPGAAKAKLPRARLLAVARNGGTIVGVAAIKRERPTYAAGIAKRSEHAFAADRPELGYVAVDSRHQREGLSARLVSALLADRQGLIFATTSDGKGTRGQTSTGGAQAHAGPAARRDRMKKTLAKAGFLQRGRRRQALQAKSSRLSGT